VTLFWRSFLLIAALIVVSVLASFQIVRVYEREPRGKEFAQQTVSVVNLTRAALVNSDPVLRVLVQHPRQPLSRDKLMELARGREYEVFDRSIDVQISRLRKLIEEDPAKPRHIQTVWGHGYVFVPDGTPR